MLITLSSKYICWNSLCRNVLKVEVRDSADSSNIVVCVRPFPPSFLRGEHVLVLKTGHRGRMTASARRTAAVGGRLAVTKTGSKNCITMAIVRARCSFVNEFQKERTGIHFGSAFWS